MNKQACIALVEEQNLSDSIKKELLSFLSGCDNTLSENQIADFRKLLIELEEEVLDGALGVLGLNVGDDSEIEQAGASYSNEVNNIMSEFEQGREEAEEMFVSFEQTLQDLDKTENEVKIQEVRGSI